MYKKTTHSDINGSSLFPGIDIPGYVDAFYRAYNAVENLQGNGSPLRGTGKKWLDSVLFSTFVRGIGGIPADSEIFGKDFCGTDAERIIVESTVSMYMDDFIKMAYMMGKDCSRTPALAPKIFETVCAGLVEMSGGDPDEYRQALRDPGAPVSSPELRKSLDNADSGLN